VLEGGRGTLVIWAVAAVLATLALTRLLGGHDGGAPALRIDGESAAGGKPTPGGGPAASGAGTRGSPEEEVFVHVAGAVRRPGLYRLDPAARVAEALQQAGGPLPRAELTAVNLAARVADGQQVIVPVAGRAGGAALAPGAAVGAGAAGSLPGGSGTKLSLGAATPEQLEELDGIGPTLAERIIEYRDAQGVVTSLDQLAEIDGIGEKRLAALREGLQP
jgi:competence protein ComEA